MASLCLSELFHIHASVRALRSSNQLLLCKHESRLKLGGDRGFVATEPDRRTDLPLHTCTADTEAVQTLKS